MRLWSFHPLYLDDLGLRRLWNESLIGARALEALWLGRERGYQNHSQLLRFKAARDPVQAISDYMWVIAQVAHERGLRYPKAFRTGNIPRPFSGTEEYMTVTAGQMEFEIWHYGQKLVKDRGNGQAYCDFWGVPEHRPHPLFQIVRGAVELWEKMPPFDYPKCARCGDPVSFSGRGQPRKYCEMCRPSSRRDH